MKNWELCPKCNGDKILVVNIYGGCECPMCNGSGLISSFTGKPPEWSYNKTVTSASTTIVTLASMEDVPFTYTSQSKTKPTL